MKSTYIKTAALALVIGLGAASGTANAWGGYGYYHHGYYHHGYYHGSGLFIGAALGLAAAGTVMALNQPTYVGPVYAAPPVVYAAPPVVYSSPPPVVYSSPPPVVYATPPQTIVASNDVIAYPLHGQSASRQASDRSACERWASNQSGFDPAQASQWTTAAQTDSYSRAIGACMKGRGYSIN